jgi:chemotaxis protein histidine kinase CheA
MSSSSSQEESDVDEDDEEEEDDEDESSPVATAADHSARAGHSSKALGSADGGSEQASKQVAPEKASKQVAPEKASKQAASEQASKQATSEKASKQAASEKASKQAASEQANKQAASEQASNQAASEQASNQAAPEQVSKQAASEQATSPVHEDSSGEHASNENNHKLQPRAADVAQSSSLAHDSESQWQSPSHGPLGSGTRREGTGAAHQKPNVPPGAPSNKSCERAEGPHKPVVHQKGPVTGSVQPAVQFAGRSDVHGNPGARPVADLESKSGTHHMPSGRLPVKARDTGGREQPSIAHSLLRPHLAPLEVLSKEPTLRRQEGTLGHTGDPHGLHVMPQVPASFGGAPRPDASMMTGTLPRERGQGPDRMGSGWPDVGTVVPLQGPRFPGTKPMGGSLSPVTPHLHPHSANRVGSSGRVAKSGPRPGWVSSTAVPAPPPAIDCLARHGAALPKQATKAASQPLQEPLQSAAHRGTSGAFPSMSIFKGGWGVGVDKDGP